MPGVSLNMNVRKNNVQRQTKRSEMMTLIKGKVTCMLAQEAEKLVVSSFGPSNYLKLTMSYATA